MSYIIICTVALLVSGLTLFSGFGLGTLLMPTFALFFPLEVAIAATAIVHLANNLFKVGLVGRNASPMVVLKFALPASVMAMVGALLLNYFTTVEPMAQYTLLGRVCTISLVKLVIAVMIMGFAIVELHPAFERLAFSTRFIPLGGALSGFFGGLSGHQGALRTAFLSRAGLDKDVFVGTMVVSAVVVDLSRLLIYGVTFFSRDFAMLRDQGGIGLVIAGSLAAFAGAFIATRFLKKITMRTIQITVGVMLFLLSIAIGTGII